MKNIISFYLKIIFRACFALLLVTIFSSCASQKVSSLKYPVYVTNTRVIDLLPTENMVGEIDSLYLLTASFNSQSFSVQTFLQATPNGIFLKLFNDFGTDMGSLSYTNDFLSLESQVFPNTLKAQYIIADIQFAYYDVEALKQVLSNSKLDLIVTQTTEGQTRKIMNGKKCIEEIIKSDTNIKITNYLRKYEYTLVEAQ